MSLLLIKNSWIYQINKKIISAQKMHSYSRIEITKMIFSIFLNTTK